MASAHEHLDSVAGEIELGELGVLSTAMRKTMDAYNAEPSRANLDNWQAARRSYHAMVEELEEKYGLRDPSGDQAPVEWQSFADTRNKADVLRWINASGYDVPMRTFYRHCKRGICPTNEQGLFTWRLVKRYIETMLVRSNGHDNSMDNAGPEDLEAEKKRTDIERNHVIIERERHKLSVDQGKYIPRADLGLEMAARALLLSTSFAATVRELAPQWCLLVGGRQDKVNTLIDAVLDAHDAMFDGYASTNKQWEVLLDA